jgi:23S rRNA (adenine2030-N6)-methyltransferase
MNYRHAYHAGNHGDVLKHAILVALIERLHDKPSPIFMLDTHAGIGVYDLESIEARKTGEWQNGIGRVSLENCPALAHYLALLPNHDAGDEMTAYPGSPAIAAALMRPGDRLVLSELHPQDAQSLRDWARGRDNVSVHRRDAYEILKAMLPPPEKRGLIIVDPPYEATDEYEKLAAAVIGGHRKWPGGRWLIWHPIKDRAPVWRLEEALLAGGIDNLLSAELLVRPADGVALAGSGVLMVNPPYGMEDWLRIALAQMQSAIAPESGSYDLRKLGGS